MVAVKDHVRLAKMATKRWAVLPRMNAQRIMDQVQQETDNTLIGAK